MENSDLPASEPEVKNLEAFTPGAPASTPAPAPAPKAKEPDPVPVPAEPETPAALEEEIATLTAEVKAAESVVVDKVAKTPEREKAAAPKAKENDVSVTRNFVHAAASAFPVRVSATSETVTVNANSSNVDRVWTSTDPRVVIWPWYGQQIAPGGTANVNATAGQTVYTVAHTEPANVSVVTAT